ncbi:sensor histidine kinase [Ktedonospora formicarum]|uniref:histidine kinase n=1 Tax=Ktedonospora formicarum TaxID=2778364 RepID=A0A8J3IFP0_9CHLR|nr:ATP-binding protein [Ktedonospora formicarum]GHO51034.1 hypothetical protein KSX_91970 [Ktedonospora formicarum]
MDKGSHRVTPRKLKRGGTPDGKSILRSRSGRLPPHNQVQFHRLQAAWEHFPDSLVACDHNQRILRINAAACKLFEVASEAQYLGKDYQQFLNHYIHSDEQSSLVPSGQWLMSLMLAGKMGTDLSVQTLLLGLPSGRKIPVTVRSFPVIDQELGIQETVFVFHELTYYYQEVFHLQRVYESMLDLLTAIMQIPGQREYILPEETFLLSPPVLFVAQQVVNIIQQVLNCHDVEMFAFARQTGHLHFVAGTGLTDEQEQRWQDMRGCFHLRERIDDAIFARLSANQEVVLTSDQLRSCADFGHQQAFLMNPNSTSPDPEIFLLIPLFLEQQWIGMLLIGNISAQGKYTPEEIGLAKIVTAQTMLLIEGIHYFYAQEEKQKKVLARREVTRQTGEFLTLASHELRTPLTRVLGNLQLAQRRLETLKKQLPPLSAQLREPIDHVQRPLVAASQGAQLQQRIINDLVDDARIQTHTLMLSLHPEDLLALLRDEVNKQQQSAPEHPIVLDVPSSYQSVPVIADVERIKYVLNTYLINALVYSSPECPVTVRLRIAESHASVSVHNEGSGIAKNELDHIWERFYRTKGTTVQHELDLSFGLTLYLCRAFIELQQGRVGVQSAPGQGATFWFTLPIATSL